MLTPKHGSCDCATILHYSLSIHCFHKCMSRQQLLTSIRSHLDAAVVGWGAITEL